MPIEPIPLANLQESGYEEQAGATPISMNIVVDGKGVVTKRPCVQAYSGATSAYIDNYGIDAIQATFEGNLYAVGGYDPAFGIPYRNIYRVTPGGAVSLTPTNPEKLIGNVKPIICETEMLLVFAAGDRTQKLVKTTNTCSALGGNPPHGTFIINNWTRLLENDILVDRSAVRWSNGAGGTVSYAGHELWPYGGWGTGGYFETKARADPVVALADHIGQVFVWGEGTLQLFQPEIIGTITSNSQTYSATSSYEYGCSAPYSLIRVEESYAWLDNQRQFVVFEGGGVRGLSEAIQKDLDDIADVSDCFGYRVKLSGLDALVWTFPTDGRTFVYQKNMGWGQWAGWYANTWARCPVNCAFVNPNDGATIVGTTDGRIGELSLSAYSDFVTAVPAYVQTGYLDHKTGRQKWCKDVIITVRRGDALSTTEPVAYLSFSDQRGVWTERFPITLGIAGDTISVVRLGPMGTYRQRAWKFEFSPNARLALVGIEEDYEVLEV